MLSCCEKHPDSILKRHEHIFEAKNKPLQSVFAGKRKKREEIEKRFTD
jgi:hypothetical protein